MNLNLGQMNDFLWNRIVNAYHSSAVLMLAKVDDEQLNDGQEDSFSQGTFS